jgi:diguanylate cyclase (GGDEF)-like protein/PAS domain S-box-containing protein
MDGINRPTLVSSILPILIGVLTIAGYMFHMRPLVQLFPGAAPMHFFAAMNAVLAGGALLSYSFTHLTHTARFQTVAGGIIIITSAFILLQKFVGMVAFDTMIYKVLGMYHWMPIVPMHSFSLVSWMIVGTVLIIVTNAKSRGPIVLAELLTFTVILFALLGFVTNTIDFEFLFSWYGFLSLPIQSSISIISICVGLMGILGQSKRYQSHFEGKEEKKVILFSGALMLQAAITAGLIGFGVVAHQNEKFLKFSIEHNLHVRSEVVKDVILQEVLIAKNLVQLQTIQSVISQKSVSETSKKSIYQLLKVNEFSGWHLENSQGKILYESGKINDDILITIELPAISIPAEVVWSKNWFLRLKVPILNSAGKEEGILLLERPIPALDHLLMSYSELSLHEEKMVCAKENNLVSCFSSLASGKSFITTEYPYEAVKDKAYGAALQGKKGIMIEQSEQKRKQLVAYAPIPTLGLGIILKADLDDIYQSIYDQIKVTLPIVLWFIVFSMVLLNWQVMPLVRKVIKSERDAIDSARMLMENEARLSAIVDNIGEAILIFDEHGRIENINIRAGELFGYHREDIIGATIDRLMDVDKSMAFDHLLTGRKWQEVIAKVKDGQKFPAEYLLSEMFVRQKRIFLGLLRDITERKETERKIRSSEDLFRSSFDYAPIGMGLIDIKNKRWIRINQALCTLVGYAEEEIRDKEFHALTHPDDLSFCLRSFQALFNKEVRSLKIEKRYIHKAGRVVWIDMSASIVLDDTDMPVYVIAQIQDITERKLIEDRLNTATEQLKTRLEELQAHTNESTLLTEMSGMLQSCLSLEEAVEPIKKYSSLLMPKNLGVLYFNSPENNYLEPVAYWGAEEVRGEVFSAKDCWALRRGQLYLVDSQHPHVRCNHVIADRKDFSYMCIPLIAQGETVGMLYIEGEASRGKRNGHHQIPESTKLLATTLADQVALALANIRLRESLEHQSVHDSLTGLYNRRYLEEALRREFARAERRSLNVGVLIIDIDHFKDFNDNYGHEAGDLVLQALASVLEKHIRGSDVACRLGGEEFVVVLTESNSKILLQRGEELREAVERLQLKHNDKSLGKVTISIGGALYPHHGKTIQSVLESADRALYQAKNNGRNQVVLAEEDI